MGRNSNSNSNSSTSSCVLASVDDIFLYLLFLLLLIGFTFADPSTDPCSLVQCGQGTCKVSRSFPMFECECYPGWTKPQFLTITVPFCIVPNCTLNMQCGVSAPPPPPPPPPAPAGLRPLNLTDPCFLVWCGEGQCVRNEVAHNHTCQCNDGSANLLGVKALPCFTQCSLGADCKGVSFGPPLPPPPPTSSAPPLVKGKSSPPTPPLAEDRTGAGDVPSCSRSYRAFSLVAATTIALIWI